MLDIYVLEDNIIQQFRMGHDIATIMSKNNWDYQRIEVFSSANEIIAKATEKGEHQIFFLDLEIKDDEKQGIDVAKAIREKDATAIIVFVTTHSEFMLLTYQALVGAIDFIDKNLNDQAFSERIELCLKEAMKHQNDNFGENSFLFETPKARVRVLYSDILYFETSPAVHRVILHTNFMRRLQRLLNQTNVFSSVTVLLSLMWIMWLDLIERHEVFISKLGSLA